MIPIIDEHTVTSRVKTIERRNPYITLAKTSLALLSVPRKCFLSGGEGAVPSISLIVL